MDCNTAQALSSFMAKTSASLSKIIKILSKDDEKQQYVITFESASQCANSQALHDMLKMIADHDGHIDFISESNSNPQFKTWTVVYTATVDLSMYCPKSCYSCYR